MIDTIKAALDGSDYTAKQAREVNLVETGEERQENLRRCEKSEIAVEVN